jgi:hypothetical protein
MTSNVTSVALALVLVLAPRISGSVDQNHLVDVTEITSGIRIEADICYDIG